jgi:hypothetical protein
VSAFHADREQFAASRSSLTRGLTRLTGQLAIRFTKTPALIGDLEHYQYDTFIARWTRQGFVV